MPPSTLYPTVSNLTVIAQLAGVTRIADLTGLDRLGLPVVQAVRPTGKSLSTTMGKGPDIESARIGALMEAIEVYCAEEATAPLMARGFHSGRLVEVPLDEVSLDLTQPDARLLATSNGLASGRTVDHALLAALAELVERDRLARWTQLNPVRRAQARIQLDTIEDKVCRTMIAQVGDAACTLLVWDLSAGPDHLPVFTAAILDDHDILPPAFGAAARMDPSGALLAAIGEAAQTRAALIAGSRDDMGSEYYETPRRDRARILLETLAFLPAERAFPPPPDLQGDALGWLADRTERDGGGPVLWVNLSRPEFGVPVVKAIAPSLKPFENTFHAWRRRG